MLYRRPSSGAASGDEEPGAIPPLLIPGLTEPENAHENENENENPPPGHSGLNNENPNNTNSRRSSHGDRRGSHGGRRSSGHHGALPPLPPAMTHDAPQEDAPTAGLILPQEDAPAQHVMPHEDQHNDAVAVPPRNIPPPLHIPRDDDDEGSRQSSARSVPPPLFIHGRAGDDEHHQPSQNGLRNLPPPLFIPGRSRGIGVDFGHGAGHAQSHAHGHPHSHAQGHGYGYGHGPHANDDTQSQSSVRSIPPPLFVIGSARGGGIDDEDARSQMSHRSHRSQMSSARSTRSILSQLYMPRLRRVARANGGDHDDNDAASQPATNARHIAGEGTDADHGHTPNSTSSNGKRLTILGRKLHFAFVRTYTAPLDVNWSTRSFDMHYGLMYKDPVIADQFRAFYFRSFLSFTMGTIYAFAFLLLTTIVTGQYVALWASAAAVLFIAMSIDMVLHVFAPVTPTVATARMVVCFVTGLVPVIAQSWTMFSVMTACDSWPELDFPGRVTLSTFEQRRLCVQIFEPFQIAAITLGSLGAIVYPLPHAFIAVLHFILCFVVGRQVAHGEASHEEYGAIGVEAAMLLVCEVGAMAITYVRFSAGRSAFEATIRVEVQRREASDRAMELFQLLHTIVPAAVLPRLEAGGAGQFRIDRVSSASMLFADMKGFTAWSSSRSAESVTSMLNTVVAVLDALAVRTDAVEKIKTVGDAYWAVAGIPVETTKHADQLLLFGWRMNRIVAELNVGHREWGGVAWRVGIHSGPMTGALFGERQVSYEVFGQTAQLTQVVEANGVPGSVVVTEQTLAAMLLKPESKYIRPHETVEDQGPNGSPLVMYEMYEPRDEKDGDGSSNAESIASTVAITPIASLSMVLPASVPMNLIHPAPPSSRRSFRSQSTRRSKPANTRENVQFLRHTVPSLTASENPMSQHELEASFDDEALEALEKREWQVLPYYQNPAIEDQFKARSEVVCRNMNRVCSVIMLMTHLVYMASLVATDLCFHPVGVTMQFLALLPYGAAVFSAAHPTLSLRIATGELIVGVFIGMLGTGLTSLNGCEMGHDLQVYAFIAFAAIFSAAGPISWPVLLLVLGATNALPAIILALFFSPVPVAALVFVPVAGIMSTMIAIIEERLLRRRFIEEELATRGEAQLAALGEQRSEVLERLVPRHIVSDLIAWFGSKMDPDRCFTRSYRRVVIAFLRLRPLAIEALPKLHADVDADLLALAEERCAAISPRFNNHHGNASPRQGHYADDGHSVELEDSISVREDAAAAQSRQVPEPALVSTLDKIKTVGDIVMVAGPFPTFEGIVAPSGVTGGGAGGAGVGGGGLGLGVGTNSDAVSSYSHEPGFVVEVVDDEVLASFNAVVALFTRVRARCQVQVGAHIGSVVGTVQGVSRLAFDVFGDPVNVASRVLTVASGTGSSMHASGTLATFVEHNAARGSAAPTFGSARPLAAKGKGLLEVRTVQV